MESQSRKKATLHQELNNGVSISSLGSVAASSIDVTETLRCKRDTRAVDGNNRTGFQRFYPKPKTDFNPKKIIHLNCYTKIFE